MRDDFKDLQDQAGKGGLSITIRNTKSLKIYARIDSKYQIDESDVDDVKDITDINNIVP